MTQEERLRAVLIGLVTNSAWERDGTWGVGDYWMALACRVLGIDATTIGRPSKINDSDADLLDRLSRKENIARIG